ncbi:kynureninase [Alteromonas sp. H39]|uniref:kynureninase n=1 Tax=Alteromonas sp. H39 TaxID=3389876 RepID=UPI0039E18F5A
MLDKQDPLADKKALFALPDNVIYLDGNSLGAMPLAAKQRAETVVCEQWGNGLITSWNQHNWIGLPQRVGNKIGNLVGAAEGQVVCCDSISVNLFKVLSAALKMRPDRQYIATTKDNFPTDIYMAEGLIAQLGDTHKLTFIDEQNIVDALHEDIAVLMLTQVNFRSGYRQDMKAITKAAHDKGILVVWDLAHSAGAFEVELDACEADFAVGCTYKYLNGGPGAPAFIYVASRHQQQYIQPLSGWMGHASPFNFDPHYQPADGIKQNLSGTPGVVGMSILEASLEVFDGIDLCEIRNKSVALMEWFSQCLKSCGLDTQLESFSPPVDVRGSQLAFRHPEAYAICQAWIAEGVIADFRAPDILRIGFAPLYLSFSDIADAVTRLRDVVQQKTYLQSAFQQKQAVT